MRSPLGSRIPLASLIQALAVAEHLNFRHAANVLGVSQSSVSTRMKRCWSRTWKLVSAPLTSEIKRIAVANNEGANSAWAKHVIRPQAIRTFHRRLPPLLRFFASWLFPALYTGVFPAEIGGNFRRYCGENGRFGAPEEIRTPDPQIRSLVLYPAELRARWLPGRQRGRGRIARRPDAAYLTIENVKSKRRSDNSLTRRCGVATAPCVL